MAASFPFLVLNRRAASNGKPYLQAEMRFDENDVETSDMDTNHLPAALERCQKLWGFRFLADDPPFGWPGAGGQYIYAATAVGRATS